MMIEETVGAQYVAMYMQRLQDLEEHTQLLEARNTAMQAELHALRCELNARAPRVYMVPATGYTDFNDGYTLSWNLLMLPELCKDEKDRNGSFSPLDEQHKTALFLPTGLWMQLQPEDGAEDVVFHRFLGHPGRPVTVQDFVTEVHAWLLEPGVAEAVLGEGNHTKVYAGLTQADGPFYPCTDMLLMLDG